MSAPERDALADALRPIFEKLGPEESKALVARLAALKVALLPEGEPVFRWFSEPQGGQQ